MTDSTRILSRNLVLTFLGQFAISSVYCLLVPTLPIYLSRTGATEIEIGVLIGAFGLSSLVLRPFVGRRLLKTSEWTFMIAGAILLAVTSAAYLLAPPFWPFLMVRIFQGIGSAFFYTAAVTFVASRCPEARLGQILSYYYLGFNLAFAMVPSLGMFLINSFSFTLLFLFCTGLSVLSLLIITRLERGNGHAPEASAPEDDSLLSRNALSPAMVAFMADMTWGALTAFFPLYAINHGMTNPGLFFSTFAVVVVVGRGLGARLLDLYDRERVILPCLAAYIVAIGLLLVFKTPGLFLVSAGVWGLGHALLFPALIAHMLKLAGPSRGPAMGTFTALDDLGVGLGPVIMGIVLRFTNYPVMFGALALVGLLNINYFYFFVRKRQKNSPGPPL
jgi:predicted MFS family arabinose efflux permease